MKREKSGVAFLVLGSALFANVVAFFGVNYFDQSRIAWFALLAMVSACTTPVLKLGFTFETAKGIGGIQSVPALRVIESERETEVEGTGSVSQPLSWLSLRESDEHKVRSRYSGSGRRGYLPLTIESMVRQTILPDMDYRERWLKGQHRSRLSTSLRGNIHG